MRGTNDDLHTEPRDYVPEKKMGPGHVIKDSGQREQFTSGMQRDTTEGKIDYLLTRDGPMYERWAAHLTAGAKKYDKRNWMKASGNAELQRFRESAVRHFEAWLRGDGDEDHASGVYFNINGAEYVKKLKTDASDEWAQLGRVIRGWAERRS